MPHSADATAQESITFRPPVDTTEPPIAPSPFCCARGWLLAIFLVLGGLSCVDYQIRPLATWLPDFYFSELQPILGFCAALLLLAMDRELAGGLARRRLKLFAGIVFTSLAWMYLMHDIADHSKRRAMLGLLFGNGGVWMWAAGVWLATPLLLRAKGNVAQGAERLGFWQDEARLRSAGLRTAVAALLAYFTLELVSAAASIEPKRSIPAFFVDRAALMPAMIGWVRAARADEQLRRASGRAIAWLLAGLMLAAGAVVLVDRLGGEGARAALVASELVYAETIGISDPNLPPRRLNFPMLHFNRTALLALIAMGVLMAVQFAPRRGSARGGAGRWAGWIAAVAFGVAVMTYTRGMVLGALAGCVAATALVSRRVMVSVLIIAGVGLVLLPAQRRAHLTSIFRAETYAPAPGQDLTSMRLRFMAWGWAAEQIQAQPLTGIGYGTRLVRAAYARHVKQTGDERMLLDLNAGNELQHMHNVWIETAVESGLPALAALLIFMTVRWALLLRRLARAQGRRRYQLAAWAGLEVGLLISGMVFYLLKQNFGYLQWMIWLWVLVDVTRDEPRDEAV